MITGRGLGGHGEGPRWSGALGGQGEGPRWSGALGGQGEGLGGQEEDLSYLFSCKPGLSKIFLLAVPPPKLL